MKGNGKGEEKQMEQVKRFGAGVLASVLAVSMLQTMVFAVDTAPDKQKIAGFL